MGGLQRVVYSYFVVISQFLIGVSRGRIDCKTLGTCTVQSLRPGNPCDDL